MTNQRELPDGATIASAGRRVWSRRLWSRPDGDLISINCGPWEPLIDFPDQTCPGCQLEHPGADCQQPDLFGESA